MSTTSQIIRFLLSLCTVGQLLLMGWAMWAALMLSDNTLLRWRFQLLLARQGDLGSCSRSAVGSRPGGRHAHGRWGILLVGLVLAALWTVWMLTGHPNALGSAALGGIKFNTSLSPTLRTTLGVVALVAVLDAATRERRRIQPDNKASRVHTEHLPTVTVPVWPWFGHRPVTDRARHDRNSGRSRPRHESSWCW